MCTNIIRGIEFKQNKFLHILSVYQETTTNKQVQFSMVPMKATPVKAILWKYLQMLKHINLIL
jgi:hypothetical protein